MATLYSDLFPTGAQPPNGAQLPDAGYIESKVHCTKVRYTFTGEEAASDVIRLFELPAGAVILPKISSQQVIVDSGGTLTLDIGDLDTLAPTPLVDSDADRYSAGVDCGAVGDKPFAGGVAAAALYELQEQCWITATIATLSTPAVGGIIDFIVYWREPSS